MKDVLWRSTLTVAALMIVALLGPGAGDGFGGRIARQPADDTPQAHVARYLRAVALGDREAALGHLLLPEGDDTAPASRCRAATDELLAHSAGLEYQIVEVEWRSVSGAAVQARTAQVRVALGYPGTGQGVYRFDVAATGQPAPGWTIVDVRRQDSTPLAHSGKE